MDIDVSEFEKLEKDGIIIVDAPRKTKIFPSEIGSWEYCNLKWLYEKTRNRRGTKEHGTDTE
ncbi:MAG: hypothetical protein HY919_01910 [Elusimicrobia bacterium]|nr:hypothetical protein [Elusimicrobiota bacterium]